MLTSCCFLLARLCDIHMQDVFQRVPNLQQFCLMDLQIILFEYIIIIATHPRTKN